MINWPAELEQDCPCHDVRSNLRCRARLHLLVELSALVPGLVQLHKSSCRLSLIVKSLVRTLRCADRRPDRTHELMSMHALAPVSMHLRGCLCTATSACRPRAVVAASSHHSCKPRKAFSTRVSPCSAAGGCHSIGGTICLHLP